MKWSLLLCALLLAACERNERLARALELAGENRTELEKVLHYYKDDTLKYKAACFLIGDIPGKYARVPEHPQDAYREYLNHIPKKDSAFWDTEYSLVRQGLDSIAKLGGMGGMSRREEDLTHITGGYLIRNIDAAFAAWERTDSARRRPFADFCRYVLPYRMGDEPLTDWRNTGKERYGHLLDSAFTARELAVYITQLRDVHYNIGMTRYPHTMTYEEMLLARWGTCDDMAAYLALSLRALGIPATIDFVPVWANRSSGHCWNVISDEEGNCAEAEHWLVRSTYRLPRRIYPHYLLACLYADSACYDRVKLERAVQQVLEKEPKVQSTAVRQMREKAKALLSSP